MSASSVREVQESILTIMKYIDALCRAHGITYYIMGGTALGAVRHGGFIPWDDDLDIFMTPDQYARFKQVFEAQCSEQYVLQEWKTTPAFVEYAKVRMNGTTFIEHAFRGRRDMHHGIYVDIMLLHKVPRNPLVQRIVYWKSKYVTLYALSQRGWKPKSWLQRLALSMLRVLPNSYLAKQCYRHIYRYDDRISDYDYCYWITKASFQQGLFAASFFEEPVDVPFEDTVLMGSARMRDYLSHRYGAYMELPSVEEQRAAIHAELYDTQRDYTEYFT